MKSSSTQNPLFDQIVARMSPNAAATFNTAQLETLRQACSQLAWKKHTVDVRVSVPFPGRGFYLVLLAGAERRSVQRLRATCQYYPYRALAGFVGFTALTSIALGAFWLRALQPTFTSATQSEAHATVIPWLQDRVECENTGRDWRSSACWDNEQDSNF